MAIEISGRKKATRNFRIEDLIGLEPIKRELRKIEAMLWLNSHRRSEELGELRLQSFHFSFRGNPGTGKTTVARLIGDIFHRYGILRVGDVVEVDRAKLIGPTPGETETKTRKALKSALDGVLFVDEAYSLLGSGDSADPGMRALEVILKGMEDYRDALIVIFAGYPMEMDHLFDAVTGLRSRVPYHLEFPDYSPRELVDIAIFMAALENIELSDEASAIFLKIMEERSKLHGFSNAREVRNLLDHAKARLSARLQSRRKVTQWDMKVLTALDFEEEGSEALLSLEEAKREMYRSPSDVGARSAFAAVCAGAGLWSDAASVIQPVEGSISGKTAALYGRALYTTGERKRSWEVFSKMGSAPSGSFYQGLSALWSGDSSAASLLLSSAAVTEPENPDVLLALSVARFFSRDFAGSVEAFLIGADIAVSSLPPVILRDLPFETMQWPESASHLRRGLFFAYGSPDRSRLLFAQALIATGDGRALVSAEGVVSRCIENIPDDPVAHRMMSLIHESAGRIPEAAVSLEISLELEPRNTEDWRHLASLFEKTGQPERAEEIFRDILEEDTTGGAGIRLARAAEARGEEEQARGLYLKAWEAGLSGEDRSLCALKMGVFAVSSGRFAEGVRFFREAGDLTDNPEASFWLARALLEEDKWQEAETLLLIPSVEESTEMPRLYWLARFFVSRRDLFSAKNLDWKGLSNPYLSLVRGVAAALSGDPGSRALLEGIPERVMGSDALAFLCSAKAALREWEEVRRLGRLAQTAEYGPYLWERQLKKPKEEAAYLASMADAHLGDWAAARDGFKRSASVLRHPGPYFALGVSLVASGNIDEAKRVLTQIQAASPSLSNKLEVLITQNSGIRKMMADPVDPGILDPFAFI
ncbi:MAG: AAA family ATPase [Thermovirgaceae bacterium]|nr:AAA family ATPase [Thermovirgaceae bacterium]